MLINKITVFVFIIFILKSVVVGAADFGTSVPINKKGLITYYVAGSINGYGNTDFLIDTGSGHTAINEATMSILNSQGKAKYVKNVSATLANGSSISLPVYRISEISIGGVCLVHNIEAVVLPGKTRNILGLSALEKTAPFAISVNPGRLLLSNCLKVKA